MSNATGARTCTGSGRTLSVAARNRAADGLTRCPSCRTLAAVHGVTIAPHGSR